MKKLFVLFIAFFISISNMNIAKASNKDEEFLQLTKEAGYKVNPINIPKSAILIDADKGNIIWEKNMDLPHDPASISKLLTIYIVFEAIKKGDISLKTEVIATKSDEEISHIYELSNNNIKSNVAYPVEELIKMSLINSSNVATIMLANKLSNNNADNFIEYMNNKSKELGMHNSYFNNPAGAVSSSFKGFYSPKKFDNNAYNISTAKDLAILSYKLLKKYPEVLEYTQNSRASVKVGTPYEDILKTYNYSLPGEKYEFQGVDGLKTGSSPNAGFNIAVTAKRGNTRLISIILGVGDWNNRNGKYYRNIFANSLLFKGFNEYEHKIVLNKGEHTINNKDIITNENYVELVPKNIENYNFELKNNKITLINNLNSIDNETNKGITFEENSIANKLLNIYENQSFEKKILLILGIISIFVLIILFIIILLRKFKK